MRCFYYSDDSRGGRGSDRSSSSDPCASCWPSPWLSGDEVSAERDTARGICRGCTVTFDCCCPAALRPPLRGVAVAETTRATLEVDIGEASRYEIEGESLRGMEYFSARGQGRRGAIRPRRDAAAAARSHPRQPGRRRDGGRPGGGGAGGRASPRRGGRQGREGHFG